MVEGMTKKDAEKAVNAFIDSIIQSLKKGEDINIPNFGSFKVKERAARKGRNPRTGEEINIPARNAVVFSVGKSLKEAVES